MFNRQLQAAYYIDTATLMAVIDIITFLHAGVIFADCVKYDDADIDSIIGLRV